MQINKELFQKICDITNIEYDFYFRTEEDELIFVPSESIDSMLEDLVCEIDSLNERYEDYKKEVEENYELKKIDPYLEYGISESDFH